MSECLTRGLRSLVRGREGGRDEARRGGGKGEKGTAADEDEGEGGERSRSRVPRCEPHTQGIGSLELISWVGKGRSGARLCERTRRARVPPCFADKPVRFKSPPLAEQVLIVSRPLECTLVQREKSETKPLQCLGQSDRVSSGPSGLRGTE